MMRLLKFLLALARELSGESAYARYLAFKGVPHSPNEWRAFADRRSRSSVSRARCC